MFTIPDQNLLPTILFQSSLLDLDVTQEARTRYITTKQSFITNICVVERCKLSK